MRIVAMNADQAPGSKVRTGPSLSLLSRTNTVPGMLSATSTQSPPVGPLRVLFRQRAPSILIKFVHHPRNQFLAKVARQRSPAHSLPRSFKIPNLLRCCDQLALKVIDEACPLPAGQISNREAAGLSQVHPSALRDDLHQDVRPLAQLL